MTQLHESLGKVAGAALAAGDVIDGSYDTTRKGIQLAGLKLSHNGIRLDVLEDEGSRFRVRYLYRISDVLQGRYDEEYVRDRVDLPTDPTREEFQTAVDSLLKAQLRSISEREDDLADMLEEELIPMRTRNARLGYEVDDQEFWNGYCFWDYIHPAEDSFDVHRYRDTVWTVYKEGVTAANVFAQELDEVPTSDVDTVAAEGEGEDAPPRTPAFQ